MTPTAAMVNDLLNSLEAEDYNSVISYIRFLSDSRKKDKAKKSLESLAEIQSMFAEDKGWDSEESMLADMAKFRRERLMP
nr:hypothetical protein [uncultured Acetatifactor sp.]